MNILRSVGFALRGLAYILKNEQNARIHLCAAVIAILASLLLQVSSLELLAVCFSIVLVFFAEIINSAVERLSNLITEERHTEIRVVKDITAAGVLVCSAAALLIGVVVLLRHI